ncbi:hypothetical protein NC653_005173 [Populus alba x Populus x berolinensis]|uniref:Uncharacterized protein n=1 Tax=Populus alba x Populus x berolinensis TaxID=444605 RepID=A0AAD6RBN7_9ROSI|nr:hypothetical protein NC653_005173 [Populus alba x Populus x berolinensis]
MSTDKVSSNSPSKSLYTCSSPSTLSSPSPIPNQSTTGNSMEEVWNDINLASLHEHPNSHTGSNSNTDDHVFHEKGLKKTATFLAAIGGMSA